MGEVRALPGDAGRGGWFGVGTQMIDGVDGYFWRPVFRGCGWTLLCNVLCHSPEKVFAFSGVKQEMHYVAVFDDVAFAFCAHFTGFF